MHVAQYPLGLGGTKATSNALSIQMDVGGKIKHDAIARVGHSKDKVGGRHVSIIIVSIIISVGNRLGFHNRPSVWPNRSMIGCVICVIGLWDAILKKIARGRGSDIGCHSIRDIDQNLSNVDVVLYRRHCDFCAGDFGL